MQTTILRKLFNKVINFKLLTIFLLLFVINNQAIGSGRCYGNSIIVENQAKASMTLKSTKSDYFEFMRTDNEKIELKLTESLWLFSTMTGTVKVSVDGLNIKFPFEFHENMFSCSMDGGSVFFPGYKVCLMIKDGNPGQQNGYIKYTIVKSSSSLC